jgi:2-polyprenyl-6-methoxyphenol hydroxylase-like FAD-dependent oxidoreductase
VGKPSCRASDSIDSVVGKQHVLDDSSIGRQLPPREIVVLGAGTAGLAASLALARDGHMVTLVERDRFGASEPLDSLGWERRGITHFFQPHAFIPRGRLEMRASFPDVFDSLLAAGAWDLDLRPKIPGPLRAEDDDLFSLAVRRPLIEWALRKAVLSETTIRVLSGVRASGYQVVGGKPPRVTGVLTSDGPIAADIVVDAMGRRSLGAAWLEEACGRAAEVRSTECNIIYYSRYYRVHENATLPDGPWIPTPRADLGYAAFSTFPGDNNTFAAILAIPPGDPGLKELKSVAAFEAAATTMPALHSWTNPDTAEPITGVLPMGSLQNTLRMPVEDDPIALGVIGVADVICHTDPVLALGLSFSLIHARALVDALREHPDDLRDSAAAFDAATRPDMEERFAFASAIDDQRTRRWAGEAVDIAHRDGGAYELFSFAAGAAAAIVDPEVFRVVVRRNSFLAPLAILDEDVAMQERIERIFAEVASAPRPAPGPTREELLDVVHRAIGAGTERS